MSLSWQDTRVRDSYGAAHGYFAVVVKWEPLGAGMCDALLRFDADGYEIWVSTHTLTPCDGLPRQSRTDAIREAEERTLAQLEAIRADHIRGFHKPWPGAEHGKAIVGNALTNAIDDVKARLGRK
jgi:hypothetical protein